MKLYLNRELCRWDITHRHSQRFLYIFIADQLHVSILIVMYLGQQNEKSLGEVHSQ